MKRMAMAALTAVLLASACDDDAAPAAPTTMPDAGTPDAGDPPSVVPDGGTADGPPGAAAIPITDWVHDLVFDFGPMSAPDTVDDKNIKDTDDPAAFDPLLP